MSINGASYKAIRADASNAGTMRLLQALTVRVLSPPETHIDRLEVLCSMECELQDAIKVLLQEAPAHRHNTHTSRDAGSTV